MGARSAAPPARLLHFDRHQSGGCGEAIVAGIQCLCPAVRIRPIPSERRHPDFESTVGWLPQLATWQVGARSTTRFTISIRPESMPVSSFLRSEPPPLISPPATLAHAAILTPCQTPGVSDGQSVQRARWSGPLCFQFEATPFGAPAPINTADEPSSPVAGRALASADAPSPPIPGKRAYPGNLGPRSPGDGGVRLAMRIAALGHTEEPSLQRERSWFEPAAPLGGPPATLGPLAGSLTSEPSVPGIGA